MARQFALLYVSVMLPVILVLLFGSWFTDQVIGRRAFLEDVRQRTAYRYSWVKDQLASRPQSQWKDEVDAARHLYPTGLVLQDEPCAFTDIKATDDEMAVFRAGRVAFAPAPRGMTWAFQKLPGTEYVISSQLSFSQSDLVRTYLWYLVFAVVTAAPILWFWFRPFWHDLERLSGVTEQIGSGNFAVHAQPVKTAQVKPFAVTIDRMSVRIGELIEAQKRLTSSVAHELTTPITQLVFALEMLKDTQDPARVRALVDGMAADLQELESLVAELLEFARLEHTAVFEPEDVDLAQLMRQAVESAEHLPTDGKALAVETPAGLPARVRCDAHQMHRAVFNLLRNALRYARSRVAVSADAADGRTWIHVDDDGPGIPERDRARLFEPFARTDASRTRETGGHGLGLAIVQQVAKLHGGLARIDASPLGGARVSIGW